MNYIITMHNFIGSLGYLPSYWMSLRISLSHTEHPISSVQCPKLVILYFIFKKLSQWNFLECAIFDQFGGMETDYNPPPPNFATYLCIQQLPDKL